MQTAEADQAAKEAEEAEMMISSGPQPSSVMESVMESVPVLVLPSGLSLDHSLDHSLGHSLGQLFIHKI